MPIYNYYAAIGIIENGLVIFPLDNNRLYHQNQNNKSETFIKFSSIIEMDISLDKAFGDDKNSEALEWLLLIHVKNKVYDLRFHETSYTHKLIEIAWHSHLMRVAGLTGDILSDSDVFIAQQYYEETIKSLNMTKDAIEIQNIMNEFSNEVFLDLNLKKAAINSREIFAIAISLMKKNYRKITRDEKYLLKDQDHHHHHHHDTLSASRRSPDKATSPQRVETERERCAILKKIAYKRMVCIQSCLSVIVSILFGSDIIEDKSALLIGPR